ncbi:MAG: SDR family NAD(P)-dependent oxidoreductase [Moorea sp. SIO4G3]|nr:SDR family NAD(P)-dependent oxidoreductase [Moorena sp. SIO4G3]
MLLQISDVLFRDCQTVFCRDGQGSESHIDRKLNVMSSGFQHQKFFADVDELILTIFNQLPYTEQPNYVVDMGCGDGTLLKRVYQVISTKSARGKVLDKYPVQMIGVDYNEASLQESALTLAGIPNLLMKGDIGNPQKMISDLRTQGIDDPEKILHIRSFLDHDRPFIPPQNLEAAKRRSQLCYQGVYVDSDGGLIPAQIMVQSLVEHLERWSSVVTKHGMMILEVHCLEPEVVNRFLDSSNSLHFDALQAFSSQYLMEADVFLSCAAEVGLFPRWEFSKRYPQNFPFSRITLNCFDKKPYKLRHPIIKDLPDLIALEALCWSKNLRVDKEEIQRRIVNFPQGQFVLELEEKIVGAIYSQRIENIEVLEKRTFVEVPSLHTESGVAIQLLATNILPELQNQGLGDRLLEWMLQYCAVMGGVEKVVGVTRCRNYQDYSPMPMTEYIHKKNESGLLVDQILRFHQIHGAKIQKVLSGYRPKDIENKGCGVIIEYDIHNRQRFDGVGTEKNRWVKVEKEEDVDEVVVGCVRGVMNKKHSFDYERPLMEMGIESLELLELKYLLEKKLGVKIEPNFFFKYGTSKAIASYFKGETPAKQKKISEFLSKIAELEPKAEKTDSGFSAAQLENGIAIIGTACRFPGDADSPQKYWSLLCNGIDAITEVPLNRWDIENYYNPDKNQPGKLSSRYGGFISEVDKFDADFFHISPREAIHIDPQQRILLEENWKALENAGINPESLSETETGVFVGIAFHDYEQLQYKHSQEQDLNLYFATGSSSAIGAGRLSYFLKLNGPAITVDTACSSSLSAVHLACQSIRNGECELALASGVNLLLSPELSVSFSQAGMLSPDGRCQTFDASANGYVRSEGCGVVVLKSLKQAIADRDRILAVVRGTAINQDGGSNGLTAPNQSAQEAVIQKALSVGGMSANRVSYVEAHGTGTSLGDPVEIKALEAVYGENRGSERPLTIGSVKTNIGHTEAAAGIAGLIKVVLSLQNKYIPPHLHLKELNPYMSLAGIPGMIPMEGKTWEKYDDSETRVAGVSSFGFSGTNAHVIVEEVPSQVKSQHHEQPHLLTLSAKTEKALNELVSHYQNYLETNPELELADVCYTANTGRAQFNHRLGIIATNLQELTKKLLEHKAGQEIFGLFSGKLSSESSFPKLAFLFTGQGSQYVNMGRQLYELAPTFRQVLEECDEILQPYLEVPLLEIIYPKDAQESSSSLLDQTAFTQPALFAIEYALAKLWESWGIKPNVVMGHSVGEYVAATLAGVFSLEDGLKLIAMRGQLMQKLPSGGEMVSVMASESQVTEAIGEYSSQVTMAAINGPESIVISGESRAIANICRKLEGVGVKTKRLQVSHAFHSPLMEPMLSEFAAVAKEVTYNQPKIPIISNVTGEKVGAEITIAEYWVRHVREPVRFAQSIKTLHQEGCKIFLEIGPKPILLGMGRQCLPENEGEWLPSLRPGVDEWQKMLSSLGELYVRGAKIDWLGFDQDYDRQKVELPTYPFQRESYWIDTSKNQYQKADDNRLSLVTKLLDKGDIEGLIQDLKLSEELTIEEQNLLPNILKVLVNRHQDDFRFQGNVIHDYYNSFTEVSEIKLSKEEQEENNSLQFLTFGILPEIISGFSWLKGFTEANQNPIHRIALLESQKELRNLCFSKVDFSSTKKVLDFGCGYGSDLITLAKDYPHLQLHGYTISSGQAKFAINKVNSYQLEKQIQIFNRDSSKDEFPDTYNLVFGFEVAHHIKNKSLLFSNISRHLQEEGLLVMADFIANGDFDIDHEETSSYFINKQHWIEQLSGNHLQLISAIDISQEIANYLYDPEFEENLNQLYKKKSDENIKSAFQSYNQLGKLLTKGLASYVLLTAKKQENLEQDKNYQLNQEILNQLSSYSEVSVKQWVYELKWQASKYQNSILPDQPGYWLIFTDEKTQELKTVLEKENRNYVIVTPGYSYKQIDQQHYQLNPINAQDFRQLMKDLLTTQNILEGVVHLWSMNTSTEDLENSQELGCASVLHLVQALVSDSKSIVPLWLVTQETQRIEENQNKLAVQQASLWGLGRVIALEHPELKCRRVDLDKTKNSLEALGKELLNPDDEDQIAIRGGVRYVPRLTRRTQNPSSEKQQQIKLKAEGSYLVTGGLGVLGLEVAQWMVKQGAGHIVLIGRRPPSEIAKEIIRQLEQAGARISVILGNVSKEQDVASILEQIEKSQIPLRGVIHAAGVLDDGLIQHMSWERFWKVMKPKLQGAWHLHNLTQKLPLDFFVCFSSIASLLGTAGQGNYAAGNAFMDTLASYRQSMGLPGLSINWGAWEAGGMAANLGSQYHSRMRTTGMSFISPEKGLEVLGGLLLQPVSQVGVLPINWQIFRDNLPGGVKMLCLDTLAAKQQQKETENKKIRQQLIAAVDSKRNPMMVNYLQAKIGKLLGFSTSKLPPTDLGFFKMGMDSLMAVELRNLLSYNLGVSISTATLFEFSCIQDLAIYLLKDIFQDRQDQDTEVNLEDNSQNQQNITALNTETEWEGEIDSAIASELQEIEALLKEGN